MKFKENHEPELRDIDDYHKPLRKSKLRIIIISFIIVAVIWTIFQIAYSSLL